MIDLRNADRMTFPVRLGVRPLERRQHLLFGEKPVAVLVIQIVRAVLQKDS